MRHDGALLKPRLVISGRSGQRAAGALDSGHLDISIFVPFEALRWGTAASSYSPEADFTLYHHCIRTFPRRC